MATFAGDERMEAWANRWKSALISIAAASAKMLGAVC
jgi:hypothetical protein